MIKLPLKFQETMKEILKDDYDKFLESYNKPVYNGIRMNSLKITPEEYMSLTGTQPEPVPWNDLGFYCENAKSVSRNPLYYAGLYYIQEPSAMMPAQMLPVEPGDIVLDMCAAPGGKSTALAAKLQGEGLLISNDISYSRAKALLRNIEAFGVKNSLVISENPKNLASRLPEYFDKILIDAPCSGEGMFHKKPGMVESWEKTGPEFYSEIQREIICYGAEMLKPGGYMVFSTCTFSPLEDEGTIAYFLEKHPEFTLEKEVHIWLHEVKGEGHYVTLLKKADDDYTRRKKSYPFTRAPKEIQAFFDFLKDAGIQTKFDEKRLVVNGDHVYYLPEDMIDISGLRVLRCGWYLGNIKKNRFEPSGAFAVGLSKDECKNIIDIPYTDANAVKYLKCETLEVDDSLKNGWYLVCTSGYPLGWGKLNRGTLKNKYPAGWRWQSN